MKFQSDIFFANVLVVLFLVCIMCGPLQAQVQGTNDKGQDGLVILQSWHGDFPVAQLDQLPEDQRINGVGFIDNIEKFSDAWKAFKPAEEIPEIDFTTSIVLFARNTQFYNRISIGQVRVNKGIAEILAMETMSAMPIEDKVAMSMAVVERERIQGIKSGNVILSIP